MVRRPIPTAGNLGSPQAYLISRKALVDATHAYYYDAIGHCLASPYDFGTTRRTPSAGLPTSSPTGAPSSCGQRPPIYRERYQAYGLKLAHLDAGVNLLQALLISGSLGIDMRWATQWLPSRFRDALAIDGERETIIAISGIYGSGGPLTEEVIPTGADCYRKISAPRDPGVTVQSPRRVSSIDVEESGRSREGGWEFTRSMWEPRRRRLPDEARGLPQELREWADKGPSTWRRRRSVREFAATPVSIDVLSRMVSVAAQIEDLFLPDQPERSSWLVVRRSRELSSAVVMRPDLAPQNYLIHEDDELLTSLQDDLQATPAYICPIWDLVSSLGTGGDEAYVDVSPRDRSGSSRSTHFRHAVRPCRNAISRTSSAFDCSTHERTTYAGTSHSRGRRRLPDIKCLGSSRWCPATARSSECRTGLARAV